jgi:hypothetical protein
VIRPSLILITRRLVALTRRLVTISQRAITHPINRTGTSAPQDAHLRTPVASPHAGHVTTFAITLPFPSERSASFRW